MILVTLKILALALWRDRASMILAFLLPPLVFIVFASVFAAGANGKLDVRAGVVDQTANDDSRQLIAALTHRLGGRLTIFADPSLLNDAIANGKVDAGVILHGDLAAEPVPATVLIHPGRRAAGQVLIGEVDQAAAVSVPDLMNRRELARLKPLFLLTPAQNRRLLKAPAAPPFAVPQVLAGGDPIVVYYAGAVSILFLMFTAMQGATSLIDERHSGLRLRLGLSAGGIAPLLGGRLLWLTLFGAAQGLVLFVVAAALYHVPLAASLAPWAVTALCAAAASAGIALCLSAACATRAQAQTASTFVILILAAVGGSMVPRFLMPASLQTLGWLTPHAWVIEAYQRVLSRGLVDRQVIEAWLVLAGFGGAGFLAALLIESRRQL